MVVWKVRGIALMHSLSRWVLVALMVVTGMLISTSSSMADDHKDSDSLSVSGGTPGSFTASLTGVDQTLTSSLSTINSSASSQQRDGWNVTIQATRVTCTA